MSDKGGDDNKGTTTIKVGDKEYSSDDISTIINQNSELGKSAEITKAIATAAETYGVSPEEFLDHSKGALGRMVELIQEGVIDDQGNVVKKVVTDDNKSGNEDLLKKLLEGKQDDGKGSSAQTSGEMKAVLGALGKIQETFKGIQDTQSALVEESLGNKLRRTVDKNLTDNDIATILGRTRTNTSKSLSQHADDVINERNAGLTDLDKAYAEKFGVDLEKFNQNKLKEPGAGGGTGSLFKGMKFRFGKSRLAKADEKSITPGEAFEKSLQS